MVQIRDEREADFATVAGIVTEAFTQEFGHSTEAALVKALREQADPCISLVAVDDTDETRVVGHILFSPVTVDSQDGTWQAMGLAPMAVAIGLQHGGIGSALIRAGLERCKAIGHDVVFVLGHPRYYPRFGFQPTAPYGIRSEYDVSDETFMVAELRPGALAGRQGRVKYHPAFALV